MMSRPITKPIDFFDYPFTFERISSKTILTKPWQYGSLQFNIFVPCESMNIADVYIGIFNRNQDIFHCC
jgi:hypothetical protein